LEINSFAFCILVSISAKPHVIKARLRMSNPQ